MVNEVIEYGTTDLQEAAALFVDSRVTYVNCEKVKDKLGKWVFKGDKSVIKQILISLGDSGNMVRKVDEAMRFLKKQAKAVERL